MEAKHLIILSLNKLWQHLGKSVLIYYLSLHLFYLFFSLFPKKIELQALIKYYDADGSGAISYDEFINGLRYV